MNQVIINLAKEAWEVLKKEAAPIIGKGVKQLYDTLMDDIKNFCDDASLSLTGQIVSENFETLTKDRLVSVAKNSIVPGANGIAAIFVENEDSVIVFLANVKDKQLLPKKDNKYVIVKADSAKLDVKKLFIDSKLIILQ